VEGAAAGSGESLPGTPTIFNSLITNDDRDDGAKRRGSPRRCFSPATAWRRSCSSGGIQRSTSVPTWRTTSAFQGGISPERFVELGESQAEREGATVESDLVERVSATEEGFRVETQADRNLLSQYVLVASAYDGEFLEPLDEELRRGDEHGFLATDDGRTPVEGLYGAGWITDDTVHQAVVNAGHGARAAIALARDDLTDRYWPAIGEMYVDWVVDDGRYGGQEWHDDVDGWFDREIRPGAPEMDDGEIERVREETKSAFLDRGITDEERERREREGQLRILEHLDDDVVAECAGRLERN
jgi:hypothetical protein